MTLSVVSDSSHEHNLKQESIPVGCDRPLANRTILAATRCQYQWGVPCLEGGLYIEVQCIMSNGHMGTRPVNRMMDRHD